MRGGVYIVLAAAGALVCACSIQRKIDVVRSEKLSASISLPQEPEIPELELSRPHRDTIRVTGLDGEQMFLMNAVKDVDGEMVAHDVIDAAVVTARFRNVAERHGKVDLEFQVIVPEKMQDSRWQLRFYPDMFIMEDSLRLEPVVITGAEYRRAQLKGYQQYEKFLASIVSDTTKFINVWQLELFLERNIPEVFAFKRDSSLVSDEEFASVYGITEREAVEHYTNQFARRWNNRKKRLTDRMYRKYVKVPIVTEGLRLDTVMRAVNGDFIYNYIQTIQTRPKLRKVDIVLSGDIWESDKRIYSIPRCQPLTFYISSLSAFVDNTERYKTRVVERRVAANTACYVEFQQGKADVLPELGNNAEEIARIRGNLADLMDNRIFDLDSIVVTASASPEGSLRANTSLAQKRSESVSRYFDAFIRHYRDSLRAEMGFSVDEQGRVTRGQESDIRFISRNGGENWAMLDRLVQEDTVLTEGAKDDYREFGNTPDPDIREGRMQQLAQYRYIRESLYPRLRTVRFDFHLHRKGMVKDTVHTTELDTTYMLGVQAIRDRDYERAVTYLRPYADYNTAVAYCALDYNASALSILENIDRKTAQVWYMLAVLYSRQARDEMAVQCYINACGMEPSYVHRGNLDPEISALIKLYGLNRKDEEYEQYF